MCEKASNGILGTQREDLKISKSWGEGGEKNSQLTKIRVDTSGQK